MVKVDDVIDGGLLRIPKGKPMRTLPDGIGLSYTGRTVFSVKRSCQVYQYPAVKVQIAFMYNCI